MIHCHIFILLTCMFLCLACQNPATADGLVPEPTVDVGHEEGDVQPAESENPEEIHGTNEKLSESPYFITEWEITVAGTSITLPLGYRRSTVYEDVNYDFIVDWGDGSTSVDIRESTDLARTHEYAVPGVYQVKISGICEAWDFGEIPDSREYVTAVRSWGAAPEFGGFKRLSFEGCNNLQFLASGGIKGSASSFYQSFYKCVNLATIPEDLFIYSSRAVYFTTVFSRTAITEIPPALFRYTVAARDFSVAFEHCSRLASIPEELFSYTPLATDMSRVFNYCHALVSIPADLFKSVSEVTSFVAAFEDCTGLTELPQDLFRYNSNVNSFFGVFRNCDKLKSIPQDFFKYNSEASNFSNAFFYCKELETIPSGLFRFNTNAENFDRCFMGCFSLIMQPDIFYVDGEQLSRFAGQSVSFEEFLFRDAYYGPALGGTAPDLWTCTGTFTSEFCFGGFGNNSVSLSNYNNISEEWLD